MLFFFLKYYDNIIIFLPSKFIEKFGILDWFQKSATIKKILLYRPKVYTVWLSDYALKLISYKKW